MQALLYQQLTSLVIFACHLSSFSVASFYDTSSDTCRFDRFRGGYMYTWRCRAPRYPTLDWCFGDDTICRRGAFPVDCLLLPFRCHRNGRCILRSRRCNGIIDCSDASDEWGCPGFTTLSTKSLEDTSPFTPITSTIIGDYEEKSTGSLLTTTRRILPVSLADTISLSTTTNTIVGDNGEKTAGSLFTTTSTILPVSSEDPISLSTTTNELLPETAGHTLSPSSTGSNRLLISEANTDFSSTTTANRDLQYSEMNAAITSSTTTSTGLPNFLLYTTTTSKPNNKLPDSESFTAVPSSAASRMSSPGFESNTVSSFSTTTRNIFTNTESSTVPYSTKTSTPDFELETITTKPMIPDLETETAIPSLSTLNTEITASEANTDFSSSTAKSTISDLQANAISKSFLEKTTLLPALVKKDASSTNTLIPDSSAIQSCPNNYCMQNAECIVVQGQYHCKCPSSFTGELCEIQVGIKQSVYEYGVVIAICAILLILGLVVASLCVYRYKRSISWKSNDMSTRSLSQLTLTVNAVE